MHLADEREDFCAAVQTRFEPRRAKARIKTYPMVAAEAAEQIVPALNPHGFNFAFLDPFRLEGLPFSIIQTFARFECMDVLIYFSAESLQRNLPGWMEHPTRHCPPDDFAPDWALICAAASSRCTPAMSWMRTCFTVQYRCRAPIRIIWASRRRSRARPASTNLDERKSLRMGQFCSVTISREIDC
jgi:three-Cys-motif partner protein